MFGDQYLYHDRRVDVMETVREGQTHAFIKDGNRKFRVKTELLLPIPEGTHFTTRNQIGSTTVIPKEIRANYTQHKVKTGSGKSYAIDNNDDLATELRGMELEEVYKLTVKRLAEEGEKVTVAELKEKYDKLNPGMQRMNLGNRIRGAATKAQTQAKKDQAKAERAEAKEKRDAERAEAKAKKDEEAKEAKAQKEADAQAKKEAQAEAEAEAQAEREAAAKAKKEAKVEPTPLPTKKNAGHKARPRA